MNEYRNRVTGIVLTDVELRAAYPNTSFPAILSSETINGLGYDPVFQAPEPAKTVYQSAVRDGVMLDAKGNWIWAWRVVDLTPKAIAEYEKGKVENALTAAKAVRKAKVAEIKVTTAAGNAFDGNEDAQNRMARTIQMMADTDVIDWVLADNSIIPATRTELLEALRLSGLQQAALWPQPYL